MKLEGSIIKNLEAAVASANRLRGHPVHADTLAFWRALLAHARATKLAQPLQERALQEKLMAKLDSELSARA
jgi:hypothetical protein